jgi:uncharacterized protein YndB with AHSA1/START domain
VVVFGQGLVVLDMPRTDSAALDILAPVDKVYSALVNPEALIEWLPPGDMTGTIERFDPRPGGFVSNGVEASRSLCLAG